MTPKKRAITFIPRPLACWLLEWQNVAKGMKPRYYSYILRLPVWSVPPALNYLLNFSSAFQPNWCVAVNVSCSLAISCQCSGRKVRGSFPKSALRWYFSISAFLGSPICPCQIGGARVCWADRVGAFPSRYPLLTHHSVIDFHVPWAFCLAFLTMCAHFITIS